MTDPDHDHAAAAQHGQALVGQVIRKMFGGKYYHGTITNYIKKADW